MWTFRESRDVSRLRFTLLDPRFVELDSAHFSGETQIIYRIPAHVRSRVKSGVLHEINQTPRYMLQAIAQDCDYKFHPDEIFHLKQPTVKGVSEAGWGVPNPILHYRDIHQMQVYRRSDEAIAMDFLTPFRVFSPEHSTKAGDPTNLLPNAFFQRDIKAMIAERRRDPTAMHSQAFPIRMDEFGANGKSYAPKDLMEFQNNQLLDGLGMPLELFRGTLQIAEMPTAMRLFESSFEWLRCDLDSFVLWSSRKVQDFRGQDPIDMGLDRPSQADNIEARNAWASLSASGEIPRRYPFQSLGISDPVTAVVERAEEDMAIKRKLRKIEEDMARIESVGSMAEAAAAAQQSNAQAASQGQPVGPSGMATQPTGDQSLMDIESQAMTIATDLLQANLPPGQHRAELQKIKATNETLHAMVMQKMEELRRQGAAMGRAETPAMLAQQGQ